MDQNPVIGKKIATSFEPIQLANPLIAEAEGIISSCDNCGLCNEVCPTFNLSGKENDGPLGRIYLIKEMLEKSGNPDRRTILHIDECLSCLACTSVCPQNVDYRHLVDIARNWIENRVQRPLPVLFLRRVLAAVLPYPARFKNFLVPGRLARSLAKMLFSLPPTKHLAAILQLFPKNRSLPSDLKPGEIFRPEGVPLARVALFQGCTQAVLAANINQAAIRLLTRSGVEVRIIKDEMCCGALSLSLGRRDEAEQFARHNTRQWYEEINRGGLDAILVTSSSCAHAISDYGHFLVRDAGVAGQAKHAARLVMDIIEYLPRLSLDNHKLETGLAVAWTPPCSFENGLNIKDTPIKLLEEAGFKVSGNEENHMCCGSTGIYNILQPEIAKKLVLKKVEKLEAAKPGVIATSSISCMAHISTATQLPVVHIVELLDWASGGPKPDALRQ